MFAAACDALLSHGVVKCTRVPHHLLDRFAVTTSAQRIVRVIIKRNVQDRAEIQIESKNPKQPARNIAVPPDQLEIVPVSQLLRVWRFATNQSQAGNTSAFLINRDDGFHCAEITEI